MILTAGLTSTPADSKGQTAISGGAPSGTIPNAPAWNRRPDSDFCSAATIAIRPMYAQRSTSSSVGEDCRGSSPAPAPQIHRRQEPSAAESAGTNRRDVGDPVDQHLSLAVTVAQVRSNC